MKENTGHKVSYKAFKKNAHTLEQEENLDLSFLHSR